MSGTGPGVVCSFSPFPQVSRWGSKAPCCLSLSGGHFFSSRRLKKKKILLNICFSLPFPHVVWWRHLVREKTKKICLFFFSSKGLAIFLEMRYWKHFVTKVYWPEIRSYLHQGESVATPLRSLGVLWQAAPLPGCGGSPIQPNSPAGPATAQTLCQVAEWA